MDFDASGNLIVADAYKGLLSIDGQGKITVLTTESRRRALQVPDDLDIAATAPFISAMPSARFEQPDYLLDLLEARPWSLLSYNPANGETKVLLKDLYFANGVALSAAEDFVLVNETYRYRITRYWLSGDKPAPTTSLSTTCPACRTTSKATATAPSGGPANSA